MKKTYKFPKEIRHVTLTAADLQGDRLWRAGSPSLRGLYWSLIIDLYTEGGWIEYRPDDIRELCNWKEERDGDFLKTLDDLLKSKFQKRGNIIRHKRVTQELQKALDAHLARRKGGTAKNNPAGAEQELSSSSAASKGKERKRKEKKRNTYTEQPLQAAEYFTAYTTIADLLGPMKTKSDTTNLRNICNHLQNEPNPRNAFEKATALAKECKTARSPISLFNTKIKAEFNWKPAHANN